jgi:hypothetical protein
LRLGRLSTLDWSWATKTVCSLFYGFLRSSPHRQPPTLSAAS